MAGNQWTGRPTARCRCPGLLRPHGWGDPGCQRPSRVQPELPPEGDLPAYRVDRHTESGRVRFVRLDVWWQGHFPGETLGQLVPEGGAWEPRLHRPNSSSASKPVGPPTTDYELAARQIVRAWVEAL